MNVKKNAAVGAVAILTLTAVFPALAAGGGLEESTNAVNEIKIWLYGFIGAGSFVFVMYYVVMAMFEKKQWADVLMALGKVAAAGGCLAGATWAWSLWGS
ncbi:conjugal transfer protein [Vibrio cyclitrophicus 1F175]|uniref:hypothetical protein n=1 Tax=Vibrio TaxID=662 RepID=UPI00030781D6|nr:hypothetical protein [Vibrio cyclitrophicus]OEF63567.1 conjugal transfer protein [Vibrio cyclitrophicus 1F175]